MSTTPISGLRFPVGSNAVSPDGDIHNLATDADSKVIQRFATIGARDTAFAASAATGVPLTDGMHANVAGTLWVYRAGIWRPYLSPAPVTAPTNIVGRTDGIADSWAVVPVSDPGYPFRIRAQAIVRSFANSCAADSMLHVGSTTSLAGAEPIISITSNLSNAFGVDLVHPPILTGVITGSARITGMMQRNPGSSSGSWQITPEPTLVYEVVPEL